MYLRCWGVKEGFGPVDDDPFAGLSYARKGRKIGSTAPPGLDTMRTSACGRAVIETEGSSDFTSYMAVKVGRHPTISIRLIGAQPT